MFSYFKLPDPKPGTLVKIRNSPEVHPFFRTCLYDIEESYIQSNGVVIKTYTTEGWSSDSRIIDILWPSSDGMITLHVWPEIFEIIFEKV